ncbi:MAG: hypothetical protein ACYTGA_08510, partial [Planctomycetota bacterium]
MLGSSDDGWVLCYAVSYPLLISGEATLFALWLTVGDVQIHLERWRDMIASAEALEAFKFPDGLVHLTLN